MYLQHDQRQTPRQQMAALLRQLFWESVKPTEVSLTILAYLWALFLTINGDLFALSRSYAAMAALMDEHGWAALCALVGTVPVVTLIRRSYILRLVSLVLHAGLWTFVAAMFILATPLSLGGPIYLVLFAGGAAWCATRVALEFRAEISADWQAGKTRWRSRGDRLVWRWRAGRGGRWNRKD